jgi:hypothetical protein
MNEIGGQHGQKRGRRVSLNNERIKAGVYLTGACLIIISGGGGFQKERDPTDVRILREEALRT